MYIDDSTFTRHGKSYRRVLLRTSYRVNGKVRHDTLANLSQCSEAELQALKWALKHKDHLAEVTALPTPLHAQQGLAVGAVWLLNTVATRLGVVQALGHSRPAKLICWLVFATLLDPGSRLSAVRLAKGHAGCDVLGLEAFCEDDLYQAMDWLASQQAVIEKRLFAYRYRPQPQPPLLYWYDVTSSYLEGEQNELAAYGYNRDGKKGKKQIVVGLLTDDTGWPIAVEVFRGNTQDPQTVKSQIDKLKPRFGVDQVTLVGDRGMLKSGQLQELAAVGFHYITAITKPQIEALIQQGVFQWAWLDDTRREVVHEEVRYILHRNPVRAAELAASRASKRQRLQALIAGRNSYLATHPRAQPATAWRTVQRQAQRLGVDTWTEVTTHERQLVLTVKEAEYRQATRLDGCYVLKTDLAPALAAAASIHARYKELAEVEWAFRTMKTTLLERRGIFVRKAARTQAHVFIIMLAYLLAHERRRCWQTVEVTVAEGVAELASLCTVSLDLPHRAPCHLIPTPRPLGQLLLDKAGVTLPDAIPHRGVTVDTRKKLVSERKIF